MASITTRRWTRSDTSSESGHSDTSARSHSTAPTEHSDTPYQKHFDFVAQPYLDGPYTEEPWGYSSYEEDIDDAASVGTYASTLPSDEDFVGDEAPEYQETYDVPYLEGPHVIPSSSEDFAHLFPTNRRLFVRHDDSTSDGNKNLQVYTDTCRKGKRVDLTLFHLRMHDLKNREFSLRRYCRESGREVCHSSRKYTKPASRRPMLQRSMSSALSTLRGKSESKTATLESLKRHDSGYGSLSEEDLDMEDVKPPPKSASSIPLPTNTTHLEFSNYAHIDVKRRGASKSKRYEFEYWGTDYAWKRIVTKSAGQVQISYHLEDIRTGSKVAHIMPDLMTAAEARQEAAKGGWVPPCSIYISDDRIVHERLSDVAEVIIATGLIALVDDCIKSRWHQKKGVQKSNPTVMKSPLQVNMEYVGPKRLVDHVLNRRGTTGTRHPTPLRQTSA
ncbi:MAG: hypothetical protein Q9191_007534 [Dirinaria sp. TL-2023a]